MRRVLWAAAASFALALGSAGPALAAGSGGYGPPVPTGPAGAPGGYTSVLTTLTVGTAGGQTQASVPGAKLQVTVPPGSFSSPAQLEVTAPDLTGVAAALPQLGFPGFSAVAGVGIRVLTDSGQPWPGSFTHPLTLTLTSSNLGVTGEQVVRFDGPSALTTMPATLHPGSVVITLGNDPDIAVLNPASAPGRAALSAATQVHTGRPLAGETALSLGLVVLGAGLVLIGYRRRPTS